MTSRFLRLQFLLLAASTIPVCAQNFTIDYESIPATNGFHRIISRNAGAPSDYYTTLSNFDMTVTSATGTTASMAGNDYVAFCASQLYPAPSKTADYTITLTGDDLSYIVNGVDYWDSYRYEKFGALKDVYATFSDQLLSMDKSSTAYADLVGALTMATWEIIADYNGTSSSLNLNSGRNIMFNMNWTSISSGGLYDYYVQAKNAAGTGVGADFQLYGGHSDTPGQDFVFFAVPEPSSMLLVATTGMLGLFRRSRRQD
ncbi:MAG: PEP-CTERM sorting domain-containing protein [Luteolibacter sp.]